MADIESRNILGLDVTKAHFGELALLTEDRFREASVAQSDLRSNVQSQFFALANDIPNKLLTNEQFLEFIERKKSYPGQQLHSFLLSQAGGALEKEDPNRSYGGTLPAQASANCILDYVRTKRFIEAILSHIQDLRVEHPDGDILVVDAGSGSLPVLSIAAALASTRVKVTAIEMTPESVAVARRVVSSLGLDNQIEVIEGDANSVQLKHSPHLIISETLYSGFYEEPFIGVMANLHPQLAKGGRVIPEMITVESTYTRTDVRQSEAAVRYPISTDQTIISLPDAEFKVGYVWKPGDNPRTIYLPCSFDIGDVESGKVDEFYIQSTMTLYTTRGFNSAVMLNPGESLITEACYVASIAASIKYMNSRRPDLADKLRWECVMEYSPGAGVPLLAFKFS